MQQEKSLAVFFNYSYEAMCLLVRSHNSPQFVNKWMEDSEISLNGDGDSHEDAGAEEDVVERIEKVGEEMVMQTGDRALGADLRQEIPPGIFYHTENQEQEVAHCQRNEQRGEIAFKTPPGEDQYGKNVGKDSKRRHCHGDIAAHYFRECSYYGVIFLRAFQARHLLHLNV